MEIRNFITFRRIISAGSFTKAAEELGYAQSTVTAHIQSIEAHFGRPLFDRIGKTVTLTPFGMGLVEQVDKLLETYSGIENYASTDSRPQGTLRIGAPESLMMYRLYSVVREYKQRYPEVEVVIVNHQCNRLRELVISGELDLGFLLQTFGDAPQLHVETMKCEPMCFVAPPDYVGDDFAPGQQHMVLYTEKDCNYRILFESYLNGLGHFPDNTLETGSVEAIKKYVMCGIGISFLPVYAAEEDARAGRLRMKEWDSGVKFYSQMIWHRNRWLSPAMEAFTALCREHAAAW